MPGALVRDAAIEVFRARGLTRMFANPGSTEIQLLSGLPDEAVVIVHPGDTITDDVRVKVGGP